MNNEFKDALRKSLEAELAFYVKLYQSGQFAAHGLTSILEKIIADKHMLVALLKKEKAL